MTFELHRFRRFAHLKSVHIPAHVCWEGLKKELKEELCIMFVFSGFTEILDRVCYSHGNLLIFEVRSIQLCQRGKEAHHPMGYLEACFLSCGLALGRRRLAGKSCKICLNKERSNFNGLLTMIYLPKGI